MPCVVPVAPNTGWFAPVNVESNSALTVVDGRTEPVQFVPVLHVLFVEPSQADVVVSARAAGAEEEGEEKAES